jgi:hypothetical protein
MRAGGLAGWLGYIESFAGGKGQQIENIYNAAPDTACISVLARQKGDLYRSMSFVLFNRNRWRS